MHIFNQGRHSKFFAGKTATVAAKSRVPQHSILQNLDKDYNKIEIGNADFTFLVELPILRQHSLWTDPYIMDLFSKSIAHCLGMNY